jgi:hypothetical protein
MAIVYEERPFLVILTNIVWRRSFGRDGYLCKGMTMLSVEERVYAAGASNS